MRLHRVRFTVGLLTANAAIFCLLSAAIILSGSGGRAQEPGEKENRVADERITGPSRPMSAQVAKTWIVLHETKIRPLPDKTPLRQVLQALRAATRGRSGWTEGVEFRVVPEALQEAEITDDAPITLPFVGHPEVTVDVYLKYLLHEFVWERYVGAGSVTIDSPCDDCEGYETVSAAEAHTWLLLHEVVPIGLPQRAPLGDFLSAITTATSRKGPDGQGLVIYPRPGALRNKSITMQSSVAIGAQRMELGDRMRTALKPLGLTIRVLSDGIIMLTKPDEGGIVAASDDAFPEYRFTYNYLWREYVQALKEAAPARGEQKQSGKSK